MLLADFLDARDIFFESRVLTRHQVYQHLVEHICAHHSLPQCGPRLMEAIIRRDEEAPTAYSSGIAIPHVRMEGFEDTVLAVAFLQNPIMYEAGPASWVVLIITDKTSSKLYLNIVAGLLRVSKDADLMRQLNSQHDGHGVIHLLRKAGIEVQRELCLADIMIPDPISIPPHATLKQLNDMMSIHKVAGLPVAEEDGTFRGEVNILNVLKVGVPDYLMMMDNLSFLKSYEPLEHIFEREDSIRVSEVMQTDVQILHPNASVIEAVIAMIHSKKRYYSVVEHGRLVGVVTAMDVFRKIIKA